MLGFCRYYHEYTFFNEMLSFTNHERRVIASKLKIVSKMATKINKNNQNAVKCRHLNNYETKLSATYIFNIVLYTFEICVISYADNTRS